MELKVNYSFTLEDQKIHVLMITHGKIAKSIPKHKHSKNSYEVHYIYGGKGTLISQGKNYDLSPGILFVTGPDIEHEQNPDPADPIQEDCLYFYIDDQNPVSKKAHIINILHTHPFWYGQDTQNIICSIQLIYEELATHKFGHSISINACFQRYLVQLARNMVSVLPQEKAGIEPVQLKIEEAFLYRYKDLTLDDICDITGMCRRQTQRLLEKYYGCGFLEKRTASRMAAATAFLLHCNSSVDEVAESVGYASLSSFLQAFKGYYNMTIKEYREFVGVHIKESQL